MGKQRDWAITEAARQFILQRLKGIDAAAATLEAENARLRDALLKYGRHLEGCVFYLDDDSDLEAYGPGGCCTCGFYDETMPER